MSNPIADLQDRLRTFARDRDWKQSHTPRNLAMALAGEVGELVEILQWLTPDLSVDTMSSDRPGDVEDELADVFIYLARLADVLEVDLASTAGLRPRTRSTPGGSLATATTGPPRDHGSMT